MIYKAIHHTAISHNDNKKQLEAVNNYHKQRWNFLSSLGWYVGYNYFLDVDGTITQCRKEGEETAAQVGHNLDTVSISLAGNFNVEFPTQEQISSLINWLNAHPNLELKLHRELQEGRTCPGSNITHDYLNNLLNKQPSFVYIPKLDVNNLTQQVSLLQRIILLLRKLLGMRK